MALPPWSPSQSAPPTHRRLPRPRSSPRSPGSTRPSGRSSSARSAFAAPLYEGKLLGTGEPALEHAYGLAANLAQLRIDAATRAAGLLFAVPEYLPEAAERLAERFDARRRRARRRRRAPQSPAGGHSRARRRRREGQRAAGGDPAQDAARDGRGHPRRPDPPREPHPDAALPRARRRTSSGGRSRARRSTSTRRSPTGSASGSSSGSWRTCRSGSSSPSSTSASRGSSTSGAPSASRSSPKRSRRSAARSAPPASRPR